jgi:predicted RNA binding protein YcfA (HicA-like mRNA interferase family)
MGITKGGVTLMAGAVNKEIKELVKELTRNGYQVVLSKSSHYKVLTEDGQFVVSMPLTPGRGRAMANLRALLKRKGLLERNGTAV